MKVPTFKQKLGCWLNERWKTELVLRAPHIASYFGLTWRDLRNRHEQIQLDLATEGRICQWTDSSPLTVARFFPTVGGRLLTHLLRQWPVKFQELPNPRPVGHPEVSIIIGVRGQGRLPQFRSCLASLRGQVGASCEIVLVEQSWKQEFSAVVPPDVRYIYLKTSHPDEPFNRSWALNAGAQAATGRILVLHDADMVVPERFAAAIVERMEKGLEALRLARFIFYLDEPTSQQVQENHAFSKAAEIENVVQNAPNPLAILKEAYLRIGGHDEGFYGWGGEDNEFMDRMRTLRIGEGAFLPIIHLWHPVAPNRVGDRNAAQLAHRLAIPTQDRIRELSARGFGQLEATVPWTPIQFSELVTTDAE